MWRAKKRKKEKGRHKGSLQYLDRGQQIDSQEAALDLASSLAAGLGIVHSELGTDQFDFSKAGPDLC